MEGKRRTNPGIIIYIYLYIFLLKQKSEDANANVLDININVNGTTSSFNTPFHFGKPSGFEPKNRNSFERTIKHEQKETANGQMFDPCSRNWGCFGHNSSHLPRCYCDKECLKYNDCCYNSTYKDSITWPLDKHRLEAMTCEIGIFGYKDVGIYVISSCPTTFKHDSEFSVKCSQDGTTFLVSSEDGTIFRNPYCALCNNVTNYTVWTFRLIYGGECQLELLDALLSFPAKLKYMEDHNCGIGFFPPKNSRFRTCIKPIIGEFGIPGNRLCSIYQNPIYIGKNDYELELYRNVHCYNGTLENNAYRCATVFGGFYDEYKGYGSLRMTALFNIRPAIEIFGQKTCSVNEIYDKVKVSW